MQLLPQKAVTNVAKNSESEFKGTFQSKSKVSSKKMLWEVFPIRTLQEFQVINTKEEEEFLNPINRNAASTAKKEEQLKNIVTRTELSNKEEFANKRGFTATVTLPNSTSPILLRFDLIDDLNLPKRERNILKKLKEYEMLPGLPTFYFFEKMEELNNYRVTNLSAHCDSYLGFLEKNKETLSVATKLDLLRQVITTMVQLQCRSVLVGKVAPSSIRIESGLVAKIFDLSRGYAASNEKPKPT